MSWKSLFWSPNLRVNVIRIVILLSTLTVLFVSFNPPRLLVERMSSMGIKLPGHQDRRNAQNLASVCAAGQAAGWNFVGPDLETTVQNIVGGHTIKDPSNPFNGTYFGVPQLNKGEMKRAQRYLELSNGMLVYRF